MAVPGFQDPGLAAPLASPNLYFTADVGAAREAFGAKERARANIRGYTAAGAAHQPLDRRAPEKLMFGSEETHTPTGAPIVTATEQSRGHASEIFNFRGSPAPWILIGILIIAGIFHLQASGKIGGSV